jgi:hypothetical protein
MEVSLSDLAAVANIVQKADTHPVAAAGRMLGLTPEEQRAVPWWGWWGAATLLAVGAAIYVARREER